MAKRPEVLKVETQTSISCSLSVWHPGAGTTLDFIEGVKMNAPGYFEGRVNGWSHRREKKAARLARIAPWMNGISFTDTCDH